MAEQQVPREIPGRRSCVLSVCDKLVDPPSLSTKVAFVFSEKQPRFLQAAEVWHLVPERSTGI